MLKLLLYFPKEKVDMNRNIMGWGRYGGKKDIVHEV